MNYNDLYLPTVSLLIVAHNEEKVILNKLLNAISLEYPLDKLEIVVASDNSIDKTNQIVNDFIQENPDYTIRLIEVENRLGKTNAQNEAVSKIKSEVIVMTDANSIIDKKAVRELVSALSDEKIGYVTGKLIYINSNSGWTSQAESSYWNFDLQMREYESKLYSITAGNGALYACRRKEYMNFDPIRSHDSTMPKYFVLKGKRAVYNPKAVVFEKAGENVEDEFKRKIRMSRGILNSLKPDIRLLNPFRTNWFSYCYFGHRLARNNLWLSHLIFFFTNILLVVTHSIFYITLIAQVIFYLLAAFKHFSNINNRYINIIYYYTVTILAQMVGAVKQITGKSKPFWEKAETTR